MSQSDRWLFVSDVDDTLLGDDDALMTLAKALQTVSTRVITTYNSSRPCASLRQALAAVASLPTPAYLIGALGTEIQKGPTGKHLADYTYYLDQLWPREQIAALMSDLGLIPHAPEFQTPFKASYDSGATISTTLA